MPRLKAVKVLSKVIKHKQPLNEALQPYAQNDDRRLITEFCYGVCRYYYSLQELLKKLIERPLRTKDFDVELSLLLGLYQLKYMRIKPFAVVNENVKLAAKLKKHWAKGLINAVLRKYLSQEKSIEDKLKANQVYLSAHPQWLIDLFKSNKQKNLKSLLLANNQIAPIYLRVNPLKTSMQAYCQALDKQEIAYQQIKYMPNALLLESKENIIDLPFFKEGYFVVQDLAAQLAPSLLDLKPGFQVLDACSAPGGKLTGILELGLDLKKVVSLEVNEKRIAQIHQNLARLEMEAEVIKGDALELSNWWDGQYFDRILLDAPCSALGVIRRHPDIKLLRDIDGIKKIATLQAKILATLWKTLKPGGRLLYATCSVLPSENEIQIQHFLKKHKDASNIEIRLPFGQPAEFGWQCLPDPSDGFYYALLEKNE